MPRYQEIYPSPPLVRSTDAVRPSAAALLTLEYFEAPPASMPTQAFDQHHVLLNLRETPHRVENFRDGEHRDFIFHQHEIIVTPADMVSGWRWHATSKVIVITLDPPALERFAQSELGVVLDARHLRSLPQFHDEDLCRAGEQLLEALRTPALGSALVYEALARVFVIKLIQKYGAPRDALADSRARFTASHYRRVLDYVERHLGEEITVDALAREVAISPAHFARLFRQTIGETPHRFVQQARVERARAALADADRTLSEIALTCGFTDQAHFTRVFKQRTGQTPGEYRRALTSPVAGTNG